MHERRPQWLEDTLDQDEARARRATPPYTYQGVDNIYWFMRENGSYATSSQMLREGPDLRVLDIGAARGAFVLQAQRLGHTAHALSLHNYRRSEYPMTQEIHADSYFVGNAERLDRVNGLLPEYDLIVSSKAFWLFTDPLGSLEQAYDRLAPNGRIAIETFPLAQSIFLSDRRGAPLDRSDIRSQTTNLGLDEVQVAFSQEYGHGPSFVDIQARKTSIGLTRAAFAYDYCRHEETWHYSSM